ncbi:hypothetical protein FNV43_RR12375 [Rhamnella rubrinervis]|uniref:Uncharacterized protein n=1 Tax=Rhamnella rubrinervis TaxID=2594499 RepID=A0A8K0H866_9ROSA|nr:hypothetical protein FNV43_RR12375 [Rhamnella rubrinervis]
MIGRSSFTDCALCNQNNTPSATLVTTIDPEADTPPHAVEIERALGQWLELHLRQNHSDHQTPSGIMLPEAGLVAGHSELSQSRSRSWCTSGDSLQLFYPLYTRRIANPLSIPNSTSCTTAVLKLKFLLCHPISKLNLVLRHQTVPNLFLCHPSYSIYPPTTCGNGAQPQGVHAYILLTFYTLTLQSVRLVIYTHEFTEGCGPLLQGWVGWVLMGSRGRDRKEIGYCLVVEKEIEFGYRALNQLRQLNVISRIVVSLLAETLEKWEKDDSAELILIKFVSMEKGRRASHAGSWYTDNPEKLTEEWLRASGLTKSPDVGDVIAPSRVFLLGPSRQHYTPKCALSMAPVYKTPIGDLPVDLEVIEELNSTGKFEMMDIRVDEAEHSMEMHLLYLAKVFEGRPVKVVPILVGALNAEIEKMYGLLLVKYMIDPNNFFSVLSDFCGGGTRFNYMYYSKKHGAVYKYIEALDRMGMDKVETHDPDAFNQYLLEYENTIYGRHPIGGFLHRRGRGIPFFLRPGHSESSSMAGRHSSMEELAFAALPSSSSMAGRRPSMEELAFAALLSVSSKAGRLPSMEELALAATLPSSFASLPSIEVLWRLAFGTSTRRLTELPPKRNADEEPPYRRRRIDSDSIEEPSQGLEYHWPLSTELAQSTPSMVSVQSLVMESQGTQQPFSLGVAHSTQHPPPPVMDSQGTQPPSAAPTVHNCPPPPVKDSEGTQPPSAAPTVHNCPRQPFSSGVAQSTQHPPPPVMDSQDTQPPFAAPTVHNGQSSGGVCIHIANCMGIYFS